ncbi:MAG: DNA translocase FtsK [Puniceicoccales bacterium]|nr:DNA translocase FtsK [Puniceicoccales bacterium]
MVEVISAEAGKTAGARQRANGAAGDDKSAAAGGAAAGAGDSAKAALPAKRRRRRSAMSERSRPLLAVSLAVCGVLLLLALADFNYNQRFFFSDGFLEPLRRSSALDSSNIMGRGGATAAVLLFNLAGLASFFIPFALLVAAGYALFKQAHKLLPWRVTYMNFAFVALASLLAFFDPGVNDPASVVRFFALESYVPKSGVGGALGKVLYNDAVSEALGDLGALVLFSAAYIFCLTGVFAESPARNIAAFVHHAHRRLRDRWLEYRRRQAAFRAARAKLAAERRAALLAARAASAGVPTAAGQGNTATGENPAQPANGRSDKRDGGEDATTGAGASTSTGGDAEDAASTGDAAGVSPLSVPPVTEVDYSFLKDPLGVPLPDFDTLTGDGGEDDENSGDEADADSADTTGDGSDGDATGTTAGDAASASASTDGASASETSPAASAGTGSASDDAAGAGTAGPTILGEEVVERADPAALAPKKRGDYQFPSSELLDPLPVPDESVPTENFSARADIVVGTLADFKIDVKVAAIQPGPVVTRYEIRPERGVKVEKIAGLQNNIAMALKAKSIRILAPVPGKDTVGIEVPNASPKPVLMREILESRAWAERKGEIPVVLGKEVTGKPVLTDLAKMPHLLIAGSTGSGKSVCINCILTSLIYNSGPDDLRLILVDPKVVEMHSYQKLPHLLIPVVHDAKKVPGALKWLIDEMERRYQLFAKWNVRNIVGMNAKITKDREQAKLARQMDLELSPAERLATTEAASAISVPRDAGVIEDEMPREKLPYIVCIVDEFADLMIVAPADIETGVNRLAAKARAAGIHLILATQRPSVSVITGAIKANLPSRIAFKVISQVDSRTILDTKGADTLIGKGDMLFVPPGSAEHLRAQGAFISDNEVERLVTTVVETNGEAEFDDTVADAIEAAAAKDEDDDNTPTEGTDDPDQDPLFKKAVELFRSEDKASTSLMQRRLSLGYGRAARLLDQIAAAGYIVRESNKPNAPWKVVHV